MTPIVLVSLAVLLPGARPSSRYWCWTREADLAGRGVDRRDREHGADRSDELNVSPTLSVAMPAALRMAGIANVESAALLGSSQLTVSVWASKRPMSV